MAEDFVSGCQQIMPRQRLNMARLSGLTLDTYVGGRPGLVYRYLERGETLKLHCHENEITFPRVATAAVLFAISTARFIVLDDDGRLVLVRRLIEEGLVVIDPG
jgi:hypothetical protein